jgi:hypothetical protein
MQKLRVWVGCKLIKVIERFTMAMFNVTARNYIGVPSGSLVLGHLEGAPTWRTVVEGLTAPTEPEGDTVTWNIESGDTTLYYQHGGELVPFAICINGSYYSLEEAGIE